MSRKFSSAVVLTLAVGAGMAPLGGCSSTGPARTEKTASSIASARDELGKTRRQIDATLASLNMLLSSGEADLRKNYDKFAKETDAMTSEAGKIQKRQAEMAAKGRAYFDGWKQEGDTIQNEELRRLSQERWAQVQDRFTSIQASYAGAKDAFIPFMQDLQDIKKFLSNDLNANGIQTLAGTNVVAKANEDGPIVARNLDSAIVDLDAVATGMSSRGSSVK